MIALAILAAIAILIIIPILAVLYYKKRRQVAQLQLSLREQEPHQTLGAKKPSNSHVNSLPCRLKKKTSSAGGSRSAAGESGVYDMAEISQLSEM